MSSKEYQKPMHQPIRVGAINIDTSHPLAFGDLFKEDDRARYYAVYDDSFRSDEEIQGFMERFNVEKRCDSLEDLAEITDVAFIHACNWDDHLRLAKPFLAVGKPVFIDKPLVGSLEDVEETEQLLNDGAKILGSSSARYAYEIQDFLEIPLEERGEIVHVYGTSGMDEFNYGIHIVEAIGGLLGTGAEAVTYAGRADKGDLYAETWCIRFADGPGATFTIETGVWQPFDLTILTTKDTYHIRIDSNQLYRSLLDEVLNTLEGKPLKLVPAEDILESVRIMLAATASRAADGKTIKLEDLTHDMPSFCGKTFWEGYAASATNFYS